MNGRRCAALEALRVNLAATMAYTSFQIIGHPFTLAEEETLLASMPGLEWLGDGFRAWAAAQLSSDVRCACRHQLL